MSDTITARAMHDRVALMHETANEVRVMELAVAEAEVLMRELARAIRAARAVEMAG